MDSKDRAVILLCGLGQLNNTLRLSVHEPLRQRLVMNFHMEGMTKEEGREYFMALDAAILFLRMLLSKRS